MSAIENIEAYIEEEFQWFHRHPELSYEEVETTKRIRVSLERAGIRILKLPLSTPCPSKSRQIGRTARRMKDACTPAGMIFIQRPF